MHKIRIFLTALLAVVGLSACIKPPQGLEKNEFTLQSLRQIQEGDEACRCKNVRLGGKVLAAQALKNQTKVEILSLPVLTFSAKPDLDGQSDGRFMVYLDGFVDPAILKDQYITLSGTLIGREKGKIDLADYQYPVIQGQYYKRWQLVEEYYYDPDDWADYMESRRRGFGYGGYMRPTPKLRYNLY
ncbi:MAG: Slp family lipoprotein [Lonepinella koalarum]|nr:Slp family lipoprotein [Lonepinella koalarum]